MRHRIFIAIPISESLQKEIVTWEASWRERLDNRIRWLAGKNLHLTLIPPWYEKNLDQAMQHFKSYEVEPRKSIELCFYRVQYGPQPRRPRLIWAVGEAVLAVEIIKAKLETVFGQESEKRPWLPHLTLARFREEDFASFRIKILEEQISWRERVDHIVLMESHLARSGADYEVVAETRIA